MRKNCIQQFLFNVCTLTIKMFLLFCFQSEDNKKTPAKKKAKPGGKFKGK